MAKTNVITLLDGRVKLRMPEGGFRPGLDSVVLAAACPVKAGGHILDLGCGVGSAGLCVLARAPEAKLTGVDIQEECIALARENSELNDLKTSTTFEIYDVKTQPFEHEFDHVICNPPFLEGDKVLSSPDESRAMANAHMGETSLEDWVKAAFKALKSGGSLTLIHRADHTDKIILALGKSFGATEIIPLWPKEGVQAKRVIIRTIKHRKSSAMLHPGLVLHEDNGDYTDKAQSILRNMSALY